MITQKVWLVANALPRRWTIHEWARSERATGSLIDGRTTTGIAHIYRCTETGAEKRFGFDQD